MFDPQLAEEARTHAARYAPQIEILLNTMRPGPAWADRLRGWFEDCRHLPALAFCRDRLETAVDDLVTLQLACEAVAADPAGLRITDRSGALCAAAVRAALLRLVADRDPALARHLAKRGQTRLVEQRRTLVRLIAARA